MAFARNQRAAVVRVPADYASLQDAIDAVVDGSTIEVTGTVTANVTIDRAGLRLRIRGKAGGRVESASAAKPVIDIVHARAVKLEALTIAGGKTGVRHAADGFLTLSNAVVADNSYGVRLDAPGKLTQIVGSQVRDNAVAGVYADEASLFIGASELTSNGINALVRNGRGLFVSDTVVARSTTEGLGRYRAYPGAGMIVHGGSDAVWLQRCTFTHNKGVAGLSLQDIGGADIDGGSFVDNDGPGLLVSGSTSVVIENLSLSRNLGPGLRTADSEVSAHRIAASGNRLAGIQMTRGKLSIFRSKLDDNRPHDGSWGAGLIALEGGHIALANVSIRNNTRTGLAIDRAGCDAPADSCSLSASNVKISGSEVGFYGSTCGAKPTDFQFAKLALGTFADSSYTCSAPAPAVPSGTPVLPE